LLVPPFHIAVVPVTPFQQNCSILVCDTSKRGAVIDPGGDLPTIRRAITESGARIEKILLTHGHIDHAGGAAELAADLGVPVEGPHRGDAPLLARLRETGQGYGLSDARPVAPNRYLDEGQSVSVGDLTFDVLHCPGHSPGSVVLVWRRGPGEEKEQGFAFMGDVLFRGSVGRTDLPGGSSEQLLLSIRNKVLPLGDDVAFLPGHGPLSTVGDERRGNPYLK
jgi:hydroxyacylglutathione hydrolase